MTELLKSHFLSMYAMVLVDGIVGVKELETLYRIGRERYNLSEQEINQYVLSSGTSFIKPNDFEGCVEVLYNLAVIAWADGEIVETEQKLLETYAIKFGFEKENAKEIAKFFFDSVKQGDELNKVLSIIQE